MDCVPEKFYLLNWETPKSLHNSIWTRLSASQRRRSGGVLVRSWNRPPLSSSHLTSSLPCVLMVQAFTSRRKQSHCWAESEQKTKLMDSAKMSSCLFVDIFSFLMFYNQQHYKMFKINCCTQLILNSRTASSTKAKERACSVGAELWLSTVL